SAARISNSPGASSSSGARIASSSSSSPPRTRRSFALERYGAGPPRVARPALPSTRRLIWDQFGDRAFDEERNLKEVTDAYQSDHVSRSASRRLLLCDGADLDDDAEHRDAERRQLDERPDDRKPGEAEAGARRLQRHPASA